jgi:hypothetical protein
LHAFKLFNVMFLGDLNVPNSSRIIARNLEKRPGE